MKTYRLWLGAAPMAQGNEPEDQPTLTDYGNSSEKPKAACVVCPGGGYGMLADHEGKPIAEWLERIGVRAFVLKYRLGPRYHHPAPLIDADRAMQYVRVHAAELGVDPKRVGVLGFSAGGHLASTLSTHASFGRPGAAEAIDGEDAHPSWAVLIYPVVTLRDPFTHTGSRTNLLGAHPSQQEIDGLSNERAVSLTTPPTFLFHGVDDSVVPIQNSLGYADALAGHRIPFELHAPQHGEHGFGMGQPGSAQDWTGLCERWLRQRSVIP